MHALMVLASGDEDAAEFPGSATPLKDGVRISDWAVNAAVEQDICLLPQPLPYKNAVDILEGYRLVDVIAVVHIGDDR
ncbi:hypothetical protein M409DRAFT_24876 [Zasmidium cellare ATCC 36951]|uniref:Uncharacterized protein n=1 Tax=Zasmidium cellare ATCC 36951 TaxID=1080233 RepID=A0A6A6CCR3_ZASCE|nr:uncharacterized protein M409DRAFT_24876 [Zasmidium cellare ATCC 36951]KAF2164974.1 hypothetical protein M409DRAFT_24876 [Zasmidium cellare ATCC 36951]